MIKFFPLPYSFGIRHSMFDIRYFLFVACLSPTYCRHRINRCNISNFVSLSASTRNGAPDPFVCGFIHIFLFAFFGTKINGFFPAFQTNGKARVHIHAAHRVFYHPACGIPGVGAGSGLFRGFLAAGKKPPKQIRRQYQQQQYSNYVCNNRHGEFNSLSGRLAQLKDGFLYFQPVRGIRIRLQQFLPCRYSIVHVLFPVYQNNSFVVHRLSETRAVF
jgi:hypothetical protein